MGDNDNTFKDIIMENMSGRLQRINELHISYLRFQYHLLLSWLSWFWIGLWVLKLIRIKVIFIDQQRINE